jgi:molecular chaperone GrpE
MKSSPHSIDDEAVATEAAEPAVLLTEKKALQEENKSLHDRLLRALADAENLRRQIEQTIAQARQYAISDFARALLTVVDNLERTVEAAQKHSPTAVDNSALLEGVQATLREFLQTLERFGVRQIDAQGKSFDPNFHETIVAIADPSQPPGTVIQVVEQGYTVGDRLLRPARVVVSKEPGNKKSPKASADESTELEDNDLGPQWYAHKINP